MSPKRGGAESSRRTKALDSAVRKVEAKEKRQDERSGKQGKPTPSIGRHLRDGWKEGA